MSVDEKLLALKRAAEAEMRREAPAVSSSKRIKNDDDGYVGVSRFDYSSLKLVEQGVPGLLLSSHFNREKSAIREVMAALADVWTRKEAAGGAPTGTACSADASGGTGSTPSETSPRVPAQDFEGCDQSKATEHIRSCFEVAKVSCSGLSLLINTKPTPRCLTDMTKQLILEVRGGTRPRFKHCLRLLPFQTTCPYEVGAMKDGAQRAMRLARCPWTSFAVGMKARGVSNAKHPPRQIEGQESLAACDEVEAGHAALDSAAATTDTVLREDRSGAVAKQPATASVDRRTTIELIAAAVNDTHSARGEKPPRVDLADPAVAILVEVVPMAPAAGCILSVLEDKRLFAVKPRLQVLAVGK